MKPRKKVLVVDDETPILRFVDASLKIAGYDVITTDSGEEALQLVKQEHPDILLLDIFMVPLSGFDVLHRLRKFSEVPVIAFSARSFVSDQALEMGASDFISKPFKPDELERRIRNILEHSRS
jgi:two-component system KDP operon response regulator KdpE